MEFDKNAPISDEQRRLAEAKQITLQPIHADLAPEEESDSEIATRHIVAPAIANTGSDMEQSTIPVQPSRGLLSDQGNNATPGAKKHRTGTVLITTVVIAAIMSIIVISISIAHK